MGAGASAESRFGVDLTPPRWHELEPPAGSLVSAAAVTFSGRVSADVVSALVNGRAMALGEPAGGWRAFSSAVAGLVEGVNDLLLEATDRAGHSVSQTHRLEVDTLDPRLAITAPDDGTVMGASAVRVSGSASDAHLAGVTVAGHPAMVSGGTFHADVALAEGSNPIGVVARDIVGNAVATSVEVVLDSTPPLVTLTESGAPVSEPLELGRSAVFGAEVTDATNVELAARVDDRPHVLGTPFGEPGRHSLEVAATDRAGHSSEVSVPFLIDLEGPAVGQLDPAPGSVLDALGNHRDRRLLR